MSSPNTGYRRATMTNEEQAVEAATRQFYAAIEAMVSGKGLDAMREAWHQDDRVTGGHPSGEWSKGWDEVWATWEVFASFGRADRGGSKIRNLSVRVCGDMAYATSIFIASPAFGGDSLACTNVLERKNGVWKLVHHHADKSPAMGAALEKIARGE
jgi:ketosteroid isomerase-like protein